MVLNYGYDCGCDVIIVITQNCKNRGWCSCNCYGYA